MEREIIYQIKNHITRELSSQKFKKNDIMVLYKRNFGFQTNFRKQQMAEKLAEKVSTEIQSYLITFEDSNLPKEKIRNQIIDFIETKLKQMEIRDLTRTFLKKIEQALNCEIGEEINIIFNHRPFRACQEIIQSVWSDTQNKFTDCLCPKPPPNLNQSKKTEQCYYCDNLCHVECFWSKQKDQTLYECPFCFLKNCLPNRKVRNVLFAGYLPILKKEKTQFKVQFIVDPKFLMNRNFSVEVRCAKLHNKSRYEITWPDNCTVYLGKHKLQDFKPLMTNSPLKRRNDEPIRIGKEKLHHENELIIEEKNVSDHNYRSSKKSLHLITVLVIQDLNKDQLQSQFLKQVMKVDESKQSLRNYLIKGSQQLKIQKICVSLKCQYYGNKIKYPVRSRLCTSHYQPFDLYNFIYSSIFAKTSTKKWKCPICDKRAYDLIVDEYILELMKKDEKSMEITFINNGESIKHEKTGKENQAKTVKRFETNDNVMCIDLDDHFEGLMKNSHMEEQELANQIQDTIVLDEKSLQQESVSKKGLNQEGQINLEKQNKMDQSFLDYHMDEEWDDSEEKEKNAKRDRKPKQSQFGLIKKKKKLDQVQIQKSKVQAATKPIQKKNIEVVEIISSDDEKSKNFNEMEKRHETINKELGGIETNESNLQIQKQKNKKQGKKNEGKGLKGKEKEEKEIEIIELLSDEESKNEGQKLQKQKSLNEELDELEWIESEKIHEISVFDKNRKKRLEIPQEDKNQQKQHHYLE